MSSATDTALTHVFVFIAAWFIQKIICGLGSRNADILDM